MIDRDTRRSRGFGFVTFDKLETAEALLISGNKGKKVPAEGFKSGKLIMRGKTCEVKISEPKEVTHTLQGQKKVSKRNSQDLVSTEPQGNFANHNHNNNNNINYINNNEQGFRAMNLPLNKDVNELPHKPFDPTLDDRYNMGNPGLPSRNNMMEPHYMPHGIQHSHMYYPNPYMGAVPMPHPYEPYHVYHVNGGNYPHQSTHLNPPMDGYGYIPYPEPFPFVDHHQYYAAHYNYLPNPNSGINQDNHTESSSQEELITQQLDSVTLNQMENEPHAHTPITSENNEDIKYME